MVCSKCEKKLTKVAAPEVWKAKSPGSSAGKAQIGTNKLLGKNKATARFNPLGAQCQVCKCRIHQHGAIFCQGCAYKKGVCSMCGVKILDTSSYRQSAK